VVPQPRAGGWPGFVDRLQRDKGIKSEDVHMGMDAQAKESIEEAWDRYPDRIA
jgi:hypothetical protein